MNASGRRLPKAVLALAVVATLGLVPILGAQALLNYGQWLRLRGEERTWPYRLARDLMPWDAHMRWQHGAALLRAGDPAAADALLDLQPALGADTLLGRDTSDALVDADRPTDALNWSIVDGRLGPISPRMAAYLVGAALDGRIGLPHDELDRALESAFALEPGGPEAELLRDVTARPDFWASPAGERTRSSLRWIASSGALRYREPARLPSAGSDPKRAAMVASMLGVSADAVSLGPNLVEHGDFERWPAPTPWSASYMTRPPWNTGIFVVGGDDGIGNAGARALRIDGLLSTSRPDAEPARAGLWHGAIRIPRDRAYVAVVRYRTMGDESAAVYLSSDARTFDPLEVRLPPTGGVWREAAIVAWNRSGADAIVEPLLRSFSTGTVWFDDFAVHVLDGPGVGRARDAIIQVADADVSSTRPK